MKIHWNMFLIVLGMLFPTTIVMAQETSASWKTVEHQVEKLDNTALNLKDIDSKLFTIPEELETGWIAEKPIKTDLQGSQSSKSPTISPEKKTPETEATSTNKPTQTASCDQPFELGETEKPPEASATLVAQKTQPVATPTRFTHPAKEPTSSQPETQISQAAPQKPKKPQKSESPEEITRYYTLAKADHMYRCGDTLMAEKLYREVKKPFTTEAQINRETIGQAVYETTELAPGGGVYWRLYQESLQENAVYKSKRLSALKLLTEQYPEFIPGHVQYAEVLKADKQTQESSTVLDKAFGLYPNEVPLVEAKIKADQEAENWLTASLTARQFALFNPDNFRAAEFKKIADDDLARYQSDLQSKMAWSTVGNVVLGGVGAAVTGNVFAPLSSLQTAYFLLQGESTMGENFSSGLKERLTLIDDPEVVGYVNEIGKKLAAVAGRNEFKYEFYIVMDENLNAFALPGGKVFINAGAIAKTNSEAELAGLLAHELSHAVLSHGFQQMTQGGLTGGITQYIPYVGGLAGNLLTLNYGRDMEEQADLFGTRLLVASGYAADGVRNLMVTMEAENKDNTPAWLSTHPDTNDRVKYLEEIIVKNNFNRYTYEGVERHQQIREKVAEMLAAYKAEKEGKNPESKTDKKNTPQPQTQVKPASN